MDVGFIPQLWILTFSLVDQALRRFLWAAQIYILKQTRNEFLSNGLSLYIPSIV